MEKPTVYFTDFRCSVGTSQLDKLKKLCIAAGIKDIDMEITKIKEKMIEVSSELQIMTSRPQYFRRSWNG